MTTHEETHSCYSFDHEDRHVAGGVYRVKTCRECGHGVSEFYSDDDLYGEPESVEEF